MPIWNPWHGCKKISPGCYHCYVYERDAEFGRKSNIIKKTANFELPLKRTRSKEYKLLPQEEPVYICMSSDFFIDEADDWRRDVWKMIKMRSDLHFGIITKRIERFWDCIPEDWERGYENVTVYCCCENQSRADHRIPLLLRAPICHKRVIFEPMLEEIHIEHYLEEGQIEQVVCGGEFGANARICNFGWILSMMEQCVQYDVAFRFQQTGTLFQKGGRIFRIEERDEQILQAKKANVNYDPGRS